MLNDLICLILGHRPRLLIIEIRGVWLNQCPRCKTIGTEPM